MGRRPPPRQPAARPPLLPLLLVLLSAPHQASAVDQTGGTAAVSLAKEPMYATARACAVGCLVYNGMWHCGVNAGYQDLGLGLGCGCGPNNACYCGAKMASSAASYITSCVSERCGRSVAGWKEEASSMQGLYDGYCRSALGDAAVAPATTTGAGAGAGGAGATAKGDGLPAQTGAGAAGAAAQGEAKGGLSQSDIIALAASLGVGVPSLLVAVATLWVQMRKKKKKEEAAAAGAGAGAAPVVGQPVAAPAVAHKPVEPWTPSPSPHISEAP
ncbi:hypothetical protein GGTG_09050 [Gaeumannomyces tritici R3-111a-1]|uniref:Extracellular membrane protein CFEM domain-containing protein n=1 Tax=Gaeumannomyces tritici (strain R3-111a-1) TaxID=644352 RepID=J3P6A9_GAET3|nr:hypothetical protein GGTG_09050 [Gaeumannomyces tritici R3-111a-1]EJT72183.1 hypothetical protein GGTG_09050 [Gaeumannomyces tritici R3-111a-1]